MLQRQYKFSFYLLISLFIAAPFYYQPNIGGLGLILPSNIAVWLIVITFILCMSIITLRGKEFNYTRLYSYCLLFPATIIIVGFLSTDNPQPVIWFFRQLYILGGLLFLLSLFQLNLSSSQVEKVLYWIAFSSLLHSLIGFIQLHEIHVLSGWIVMSAKKMPIGVFQQVNLQATYLVTGIQVCLYLISRPSFNSINIFMKGLLIFTVGLSAYIVLCTGSRVGVLSLLLASSVLAICRYQQLKHHKVVMLIIAILLSVAVLSSQEGISVAGKKMDKITTGNHQSIRSTMYETTINAIKEKPLLGYGVGSFPSVWAEQSIIFSQNNPQANISQRMTNHPHNEIMLWVVEGGATALIGILFIIGAISIGLYRCGYSRGGAYAALLIPISLHTQVELPFYGSTIHWFLWIFLIYIVFRHQLKVKPIKLTQGMKNIIMVLAIVIMVIAIIFLVHTGKAQKEIYTYKFKGDGDLVLPLQNPYFNSLARRMLMQKMLYASIEQKHSASTFSFINWAESEIKGYPVQALFVMLSDAYGSVGDKMNQCKIANHGLLIYTKDEYLNNVVKECEAVN